MVSVHSRAPGRCLAAFLGGLALAVFSVPPARAADLDRLDTALKIIPADAAYFTTALRMKEQFDAVAKSRAWAKIWVMPSVQMAWKMIEKEYQRGQLAPLRDFFAKDENKELLDLLVDAGSHELFVYGSDSWVGFLELVQRVVSAVQFEPIKAQITGNAGGREENELQAIAALRVLAQNPALLKVPDLVLGAKLTDAKRAEKQLDRLAALLELVTAQVPELKGRYKRVKINDGSFLTMAFDGSMVPWDDIPLKKLEDKPGEFAPLVRDLKAMKLTVSIGVQHGYLMIGIGATSEQLVRIGARGPSLGSRPEFKPLAKFADRKITSISYVSKDLMTRVGGSQDFDALVDLAKVGLPKSNLPDEQQKRILKDITDLSKELKAAVPEMGAWVYFCFVTERGFESYSHNYGKNKDSDGSKPLTLLSHVGGNPILAVVGRIKVTGESYATFVKWTKIVYGHVDEIARANLAGDDKDQYVKVTEKLLPLFKRLDETTGKQLIPALADGQGAFVIDGKWSSKQWHKALATPIALPLPEFGIVLGVSDPDKLRKAMTDYREIANDMIGAVRSLAAAAGAIGDFRIPAPQSGKRASGTLYFYTLPDEAELDRRVVPTAGLSDRVATLTLSHAHAERLLTPTPLKVDGGPLADLRKPLAGALYFNWPALVDTLTPWAEFGATAILDSKDVPKDAHAEILGQVRTVLEVLKVYRGTTSATYLEDGVTVTHYETVIKDLPK